MEFNIKGGASIEVFDGTLVRIRDGCILYRITVTDFSGADLKIITGQRSKMVTPHGRNWSIDVAASGQLFLEAVGAGSVKGSYEALFSV